MDAEPSNSLFAPGTVALVTGGSRGIGAAVALELAAEGATVVVNYHSNEAAAKEIAARIEERGGTAVLHGADTGDEDAVRRMFATVRGEFGRLDVLVANAGITKDAMLVQMSRADFETVLRTNVTGVFLCCREAAKLMMPARRGAIVTLGSINAGGAPGLANYAASKGAVTSFTKSIAAELAPYGIRANVVSPGLIETAMTRKLHPMVRTMVLSRIPLSRGADAAEVASVVAFLASDRASYLTGTVVEVDGGHALRQRMPDESLLPTGTSRRRMSGARPATPRNGGNRS
ncbi:3-oxoacyl-ACP reductase family protein [Cryptosporangium aurantiacum]|uniref:3-oxoacyl-[acyl-carrier-protein] reductase n=1 Tax=Cryptosporangium aurantiacum TaxID=134849 RepID=A0A1M7QAH3_9ACTN|nr:3-oxoacyl-ACP reductase family protein [Cryptosporangium aurantiacum]SHN27698.1 3-oxoacyl-[acyl-carrier-protein] reductase [Cryptosporangium aurantiacum]